MLTNDEKEIIKLLNHVMYKGQQYQPTEKEITQVKHKQLLLKTLRKITNKYKKDYLARITIKKYKPRIQYIEFKYINKDTKEEYNLATYGDWEYKIKHKMSPTPFFTGNWKRSKY